jgi:hypothetical protein
MAKLAFDERFGLLVDAECLFRENRLWGAETPSEAQAARCSTDGGARADTAKP